MSWARVIRWSAAVLAFLCSLTVLLSSSSPSHSDALLGLSSMSLPLSVLTTPTSPSQPPAFVCIVALHSPLPWHCYPGSAAGHRSRLLWRSCCCRCRCRRYRNEETQEEEEKRHRSRAQDVHERFFQLITNTRTPPTRCSHARKHTQRRCIFISRVTYMPILLFLVQFRTVACKWGFGLGRALKRPEPTNWQISVSMVIELRPGSL